MFYSVKRGPPEKMPGHQAWLYSVKRRLYHQGKCEVFEDALLRHIWAETPEQMPGTQVLLRLMQAGPPKITPGIQAHSAQDQPILLHHQENARYSSTYCSNKFMVKTSQGDCRYQKGSNAISNNSSNFMSLARSEHFLL